MVWRGRGRESRRWGGELQLKQGRIAGEEGVQVCRRGREGGQGGGEELRERGAEGEGAKGRRARRG